MNNSEVADVALGNTEGKYITIRPLNGVIYWMVARCKDGQMEGEGQVSIVEWQRLLSEKLSKWN